MVAVSVVWLRSSPTLEGRCCVLVSHLNSSPIPGCDPHQPPGGPVSPVAPLRLAVGGDVAILTVPEGSVL